MTDTLPGTKPSKAPAGQALRDAEWTWGRAWSRYRYVIITVLNLTVFFTLWELFARSGRVNPIFFPTFLDMLAAAKIGWIGGSGDTVNETFDLLQDYVIAKNAWVTFKFYSVSMVVSIIFGVLIGLMMGASKWADAILSPYVWTLSSLPRIAIFPILVLFLGLGDSIKYWIISLTAIFPLIINTWAGVKTTEQSLINAAKMFGASRVQIYRKVVLPHTLPFVVSGIQLSLSRGPRS